MGTTGEVLDPVVEPELPLVPFDLAPADEMVLREAVSAEMPPLNSELECERGRVVDEANLGKAEGPPFRELLLGAPDARFL